MPGWKTNYGAAHVDFYRTLCSETIRAPCVHVLARQFTLRGWWRFARRRGVGAVVRALRGLERAPSAYEDYVTVLYPSQ